MKGLRIFLWALAAFFFCAGGLLAAMPDSRATMPQWNVLVLGYGVLKFAAMAIFFIVALAAFLIVLTRDGAKLKRRAGHALALAIGVVLVVVIFNVIAAAFPDVQTLFTSPWEIYPVGSKMYVEDAGLGFKLRPNIRWQVRFDPAKDGDLLVNEEIVNAAPVVEEAFEDTFSTDSEGFLNREEMKQADVVVLGDSFVGAPRVPYEAMWPRLLAKDLGATVSNLGVPYYGATQELIVLKRYGLAKNPKLVIWAYFEGNDVWESEQFVQYKKYGKGWVDFQMMQQGGERPAYYKLPAVRLLLSLAGARPAGGRIRDEFNPVRYEVGGKEKIIAIVGSYTARLALNGEKLQKEAGWKPAVDAILEAKRLCDEKGVRFLLVYIPAKAHVFWPLIKSEIEKRSDAFYKYVRGFPSDAEGGGAKKFLADLDANMDAQRDLIKGLLNEGEFLDLTDLLRARVEAGEEMYYVYDTHFSQAGHRFCARAVLDRIKQEGLVK